MTFLPFPTVLSTLFRVSKVGMTTATAFASLRGDGDHEGGGTIEVSNRHQFPLVYYLRLLPWEVVMQGLLLEMLLRLLVMSLVHLPRHFDHSF